jgi:hemerythrin
MLANDSELITWSNSLSCGIKLIDDQHKGLVFLVNDLFKHVTGNQTQENKYFCKVIHETIKYIKVHFATEEKIMLATKYSGFAEHKKAHDSFTLTVIEKVMDYNEGKIITLSSLTKFLKGWILSHIAIMDKEFFEYLKTIASIKTDGTLSITPADIE